jgi:hypothetical protein
MPSFRESAVALVLSLGVAATAGEILKNHVKSTEPGSEPSPLQQDAAVSPYKAWLDEDVRWIITNGEREAFNLLSNDEERGHYFDAFWQHRDPTPDTVENEFKEEHYRRIAYANEHFGTSVP